jgi:hypothetical protein
MAILRRSDSTVFDSQSSTIVHSAIGMYASIATLIIGRQNTSQLSLE